MELVPGAMVAERYRIERKVGSGGMGEVWAGEHLTIGVKVAIKRLLPAAAVDHQVVARFKREAYLLGKIRSDHVARVVDFIADDRFGLVLVMDFVEGEPLGSLLEARPLGVEETIDLGVDIAIALSDLHRAHIVHRDIKPDNIIMARLWNGRRRAVLVDFGVSRLISGGGGPVDIDDEITGITHADMAVGTIAYMAPEQLLSSRDVTVASDVYALGAILYRAAAGRHAFGELSDVDYAKTKLAEDPAPLSLPRSDRVAQGLIAVVSRALQRKPKGRFQTADAMLAELTTLRDVARAMMVDLGGTTEDAHEPLSSAGSASVRSQALGSAPQIVKVRGGATGVDPNSLTVPHIDGAAMLRGSLPLASTEEDTDVEEQTVLQPMRPLSLLRLEALAPSRQQAPLPVPYAPQPLQPPPPRVLTFDAPALQAPPRVVWREPTIVGTFVAGALVGGLLSWLVGSAFSAPSQRVKEAGSASAGAPSSAGGRPTR
jgi:eukaryotic-like serine/threonine-protein kinase